MIVAKFEATYSLRLDFLQDRNRRSFKDRGRPRE
jgi:hypothetical protein